MSDLPPWNEPAVRHARGGGVTRTAIGQPLETMGRKVLEAAASKGIPRFFRRYASPTAVRKPQETVGRQSYGAYGMNRTRPVPLRQPDCRTSLRPEMQRKEEFYEKND